MITKNINNIATVIEDALDGVVPDEILKKGRRGLNFALDFFQPHVLTLGLRVARLTRQRVELVIPDKERNLDSQNQMLEGVIVTAAIEAIRLLWGQNRPDGNFQHQVSRLELENLKPLRGELRLRLELSEVQRETIYGALATAQKAEQEMVVQVYDRQEQMVSQIRITLKLSLIPSLEWT